MPKKRVSGNGANITKGQNKAWQWFAYFLAAIAFLFAIFHRVNTAVLAPYLQTFFQASSSTLGFMSGIYFYIYFFCQPMVGFLVDRLKPRKILTLSLFIMSFGTFVLAFSSSLFLVYTGRFFIGLGCAGIFIPASWIVNQYFPFEKRGFLLFIIQFLGNVGSVLAASPFAYLLSNMGWKGALSVIATITVLLGFLVWGIIREKQYIKKEEQTIEKSEPEQKKNWLQVFKQVIKMPITKYCLLSAITYGTMLSFQGLWVIPYLMDVYQLDNTTASNFVTMIPTGYIIGLLLFSRLSDKFFGKYIYFISNIVIMFIYLLFFIFISNIPHSVLHVLLFVLGLSHGASPYLLKIYTLVLPKQNFGTALGIVNIAPFVVTAIYQPLTGWLFDLFGGPDPVIRSVSSYQIYFCFLTISLAVASWAIYRILVLLRHTYNNAI